MKHFFLASLVSFGLVSSAEAGLINGTSLSGSTVIDDVNGKEWLDLTVTNGLSPDAAISAYSPAGWSWATAAEVTALLDQFFLDNGPDIPTFRPKADSSFSDWSAFSSSQFAAWTGLFGATGNDFSGGWYDDGVTDSNQEAIFWNNSVPLGGPTFPGTSDSGYVNLSYGVFLIRDSVPTVPEPSTFALLGIGGIALVGYAARRKRQKAA